MKKGLLGCDLESISPRLKLLQSFDAKQGGKAWQSATRKRRGLPSHGIGIWWAFSSVPVVRGDINQKNINLGGVIKLPSKKASWVQPTGLFLCPVSGLMQVC
jgi:hypothetical protein